jgi:hypothetical protein
VFTVGSCQSWRFFGFDLLPPILFQGRWVSRIFCGFDHIPPTLLWGSQSLVFTLGGFHEFLLAFENLFFWLRPCTYHQIFSVGVRLVLTISSFHGFVLALESLLGLDVFGRFAFTVLINKMVNLLLNSKGIKKSKR